MKNQRPAVEIIHVSDTRRDCLRHAFVLEALGIAYEVHGEAGRFALVVAALDADGAREELAAYARETHAHRPRAAMPPLRGIGLTGAIGYAVVLLLVAALENLDAFDVDWLAAGKTHAGLMRQGQWWRSVTALSLHSDLVHLASNIVFGGLIGLFAGQLLGSGLAWVSILIAGATGNMFLATFRPAGYTSVGASTAVFAALGLVAAYVWARRKHDQTPKLKRWAPLVGAIVLLAYLGTGGERVDVGAHVSGFACGMLLGALYGKLGDRLALGAIHQSLLGLTAVAMLAGTWALALARHAP
ncbi:MAG: rhomboid family intramembrane serine protease [Planctomycetes bacterium]|nr:rhomboid family intramembrane serine protease [Planctomycetota bacterium]